MIPRPDVAPAPAIPPEPAEIARFGEALAGLASALDSFAADHAPRARRCA